MRIVLAVFTFMSFIPFKMQGQQAVPQLLKAPASWAFERFALPPAFATDFRYKGAEELRFSPDMFNKDSVNYFTYAFVAELDSINGISQNDVRQYLLDYFKGLCYATAKDRKLVVDTSKISVHINKKKNTSGDAIIYEGILNVFGVFADGAAVKLNVEIKVLQNTKTARTYLVFIASPLEKTSNIWAELYKIQNDFRVPE